MYMYIYIYIDIDINIMRGKKDATTFPDKPVSWIASLFRGLIGVYFFLDIDIYIYIYDKKQMITCNKDHS